jgi:hypothetical protein
MDADDASIAETHKLGISASSVPAPEDHLESAISSTPEGSGSRRRNLTYRLIGGNRPFPRIGSVAFDRPYITCLRATKYFDGLALQVPKRAIPSHEAKDILEVKVVRCAEPEVELPLYTRHLPGYKRAIVDLRLLNASYGEEFWVTGIRPYPMQSFAADYSLFAPKGLGNTELKWNGGLSILVDGSGFGMEGVVMSHFKGAVSIKAGFGGAGPVKITKAVRTFSMRLYDHPIVQSMRGDGGSVVAVYKFPGEKARTRMMSPAPLMPPAYEGAVKFKQCVEVLSRPESLEGEYVARVNPKLVLHIAKRLANRTFRGYTKERGDIGEELIDAILSLAGCPQVMNHPHDPGKEFDSSRKGPDSLRQVLNRQLAYFEFKWWRNVEAALSEARSQLDEMMYSDIYPQGTVTCAYIANLDWNEWNNRAL